MLIAKSQNFASLSTHIVSPMAIKEILIEIIPTSCTGQLCYSMCSSFPPTQMLTSLHARGAGRFAEVMAKSPVRSIGPSNCGGCVQFRNNFWSENIGMRKEIGSLKVDRKSRYGYFDNRGFSLVSAAEHHPVVAIVMHGPVRNVKTVIIDEVIRKIPSP